MAAYRKAVQSREAIASDLAVRQIEAAQVGQPGKQRQSSITDPWVVRQRKASQGGYVG